MWAPPFSRDRLSLPIEPLHTGRLVLRPFHRRDGEAFYAMDSDREVAEAVPITRAGDRALYLAEFQKDMAAGARYKFFRALALKPDPEEAIGWLLFRPTEDGKNIELGYRLRSEFWGRGLVPEACRAVLELGFRTLMLERIVGYTLPVNLNSQRVFEKLGFVPAGRQLLQGFDCLVFKLEKRAWRA